MNAFCNDIACDHAACDDIACDVVLAVEPELCTEKTRKNTLNLVGVNGGSALLARHDNRRPLIVSRRKLGGKMRKSAVC